MAFVPEDQAARVAAQTELSETTFISAGAGTGKTTTIVARIVNAVCDSESKHSMPTLVAITFTERAAAELKSRIRNALEKLASEGNQTAQTALQEFELAHIGTIHSFAKKILSSYPIEAGLPITFDVLDAASSKLKLRETALNFVEQFHHNLGDEAKTLLHKASITPSILRDFFIDLNSKRLLVNEADLLRQRQEDQGEFLRNFKKQINDWFESQRSHWSTLGNLAPRIDTGLVVLNAAIDDVTEFTEVVIEDLNLALKEFLNFRTTGGPSAASFRRETKANFDDGLSALAFIPVENLIRMTLPDIWATLKAEVQLRYASGKLTFDDLMDLAVELIDSNSDVRKRLGEKYSLLVVDEFQDTDPLQWRLARLISTPQQSESPTPGSLVMVGDAQQSIYSFRGADVSTFLSVQDNVGSASLLGQKQTLQVNFRSNQKILQWVNAVFAADTVSLGTQFTPLIPAESNLVPDEHMPGVLVMEDIVESKPTDKEAELVASAAYQAVSNEWPVSDGHDSQDVKSFRPAKYSDIVILLPARTSLENLLEALTLREIPYRSSDSAIVFDRPVVRGLIDALKVIAGVSEPLDLWFALKSPLFGCDDVELLDYKQKGGFWALPYGEVSQELAATRVYKCLNTLAEIRRTSGSLKPAAVFLKLVEDSNVASTYDQTPRGRFELECIQMVIRQSRAWSNSGGLGIVEYLEWITDQLGEDARESLPENDDQNDDAVRISTVHGVKGLEFPIVILGGMSKKLYATLPMISVKGNRFEFKLGEMISSGYAEFSKELEEADTKAEQTRVLYVAATRARDHLVFSNLEKKSVKGWSVLLKDSVALTLDAGLARKFDQFVPPVDAPVLTKVPNFVPETAEWLESIAQIRSRSSKKTLVTPSSISGDNETAAKIEAVAVLVDDDQEQFKNYVDDELPGSDVAKLGNAFHSTMEFIVDSRLREIDEAVTKKMELALSEYGVTEHGNRLEKMVANMLQSDILTRIYAADDVRPELEISQINQDGTLVEGFADLVLREGNLISVLDYKTNLQLDEAKLAKYAKQLDAYAEIIESATGLHVKEKLVLHVLPEKLEVLIV